MVPVLAAHGSISLKKWTRMHYCCEVKPSYSSPVCVRGREGILKKVSLQNRFAEISPATQGIIVSTISFIALTAMLEYFLAIDRYSAPHEAFGPHRHIPQPRGGVHPNKKDGS